MLFKLTFALPAAAACLLAQQAQPAPDKAAPEPRTALSSADPDGASPAETPYLVNAGTHIPLSMINSVSTKQAAEGDRLYLETVFPILSNGKIVIPAGSYVAGTITEVKRPGRVKGRGELYVRFDSLTLPNGVTRDFRARIGGLDGRASEELDKSEGKIKSEGNKSGDLRTVAETAGVGAGIGGLAGASSGHSGMGVGIGGAAGAAAGLMGVLLTRGPDAVLSRGTTLEMVLDRQLKFDPNEIASGSGQSRAFSDGPGPLPSHKEQNNRGALQRWPLN